MLAHRVERHIGRRRHTRPAGGIAGNLEGKREETIGTNDVTSRSENRAVDEGEEREVGADRDGQHEECGERGDRRRQERASGADQVGTEAFKHG